MYLREEEEAFWALIALTNTKYQMHGKITSQYSGICIQRSPKGTGHNIAVMYK